MSVCDALCYYACSQGEFQPCEASLRLICEGLQWRSRDESGPKAYGNRMAGFNRNQALACNDVVSDTIHFSNKNITAQVLISSSILSTMFTYRGRGGPSRSTPANVTCQKCLKKD